jgi:UDP-glucose 4-epimerase
MNNLKKQRALVTGAAGFLGSHLTDELLARGYHVVAIDDLSHGSLENLREASVHPEFEFHQMDVRNTGTLRSVSREVSVIAHLAAYKIPRYGKAVDTLAVNSLGTLSVLRVAAEMRAKFVITSTSDVYGKNPKIPFDEQSDSVIGPSTVPRWAYAVSKLFDEHLAFAYAEAEGIPVTVLRIFGSYGPRQHLSWWGGPQSVFIDCALQDKPMPIHGDGKQTRSFTFVSDTVSGITEAIVREEANGQVVNVGSTHEISILRLAELIHELVGLPHSFRVEMIPYDQISGRRYEDVRRRVPNVTKAEELLGVRACIGLEEGLRRTIEWQRRVRDTKPKLAAAI